MSEDFAIKIERLSKVYKIFDKPFDRVKEALHPLHKRYSRDFYALHDVSFTVKKGETLGIIGKNGAGKSTLLKIITGVLTPTSGSVEVNGRVASLLELGAGFDPEMTGIENIYMNGALMNFTKNEIDQNVEAILAFADIGDFAYQPIKTYSSGMMVRLAFAVQSQVQPDIFIVDEALAVGDALFQKRCYQKIHELITNGTTLMFVSHDQELVRTMTTKAIFLQQGMISAQGASTDIVLAYRKAIHNEERQYWDTITKEYDKKEKYHLATKTAPCNAKSEKNSYGDFDAEITDVQVLNAENKRQNLFYPKEIIKVKVSTIIHKAIKHLNIALRIRNKEGIKIYSWGTLNQDMERWHLYGDACKDSFWEQEFKEGQTITVMFETHCTLGQNFYEIQVALLEESDRYYTSERILHWRDEAAFFSVGNLKKEYFFGGVCDMQMKVDMYDETAN